MNNAHWLRTLLLVILSASVGGLVVLLVGVLVTLLRITGEIQDTQEGNEAILTYIEDCTDPDGECRKQSEARDAAQVGAFNAVALAANWCAKVSDTKHEFTVCVAKALEKKGHQ